MKRLLLLLAALSSVAYSAPRGGPSFSINDVTVTEGATAVFTITKSGAFNNQSSTISYSTRSGTATQADYIAANGSVTFAASDTRKTVSVNTTQDTVHEANETFTLRIRADSNGRVTRSSGTATIIDDDSATPAPTPTPTYTPTSDTVQPDAVPANFNVSDYLVPAWGTGRTALPATDDTVGAFRFICGAGQLAYDDPIVYPGQPGHSHLHQFFGNTLTDANSTYHSLRTTGDSTCNNMVNRSGYWIPAMLDGQGHVVRPDWIQVYYKRFPQGASECTFKGVACVNLPRGLRYVFGYNMLDMSDALAAAGKYWTCQGGNAPNGVHVTDLVALQAACPGGTQVGAGVSAPQCWDGVHLDSANHRSHMAYMAVDPNDGQQKCPSDHPYIVPTFSISAWYTVPHSIGQDIGTWSLSSDNMPGMTMTPGTTLHSDWFGAWDDTVLALWEANCIDLKLSCAGGDLGNGQQLKMINGQSQIASPRLVPVP